MAARGFRLMDSDERNGLRAACCLVVDNITSVPNQSWRETRR